MDVDLKTGVFVQVKRNTTADAVTLGTALPMDDTIPTNTEGNEVLTCTITPKSVTNRLLIRISLQVNANNPVFVTGALFQDAGAAAIAVGSCAIPISNYQQRLTFDYDMVAGTTSATTFKVRAGPSGNTGYLNGFGGSRYFGGVSSSSITIEEYTP